MDAHNMFDEMSTRVFTEEVKETSSAAILLGDLDDIQSTRVLDESVYNCWRKLVAELQPDTPIKMLDEEALCLERSKVQLFDECSPRNMSKSVDVYGAAMNLCVWNPGISSKIKALTDYTLNTKLLILLGSTSTFGFIANANSVTQVWDPGQQRYELVVGKSKVDDTYSDVNRVFDDSSQGAASRELQPIAPLYIIFLPKLFQFLQQLLAQLIFFLQAPKSNIWYVAMGGDFSFRKKITEQASALKMVIRGKEAPKTICSAWFQGCIRSMVDLIGLELHNFSTLVELKGLVGAQGDKIIVCPPTFSLYEVVALQNCQNDHGSLYVIESELELVKVASIVVAYVVHKAILNESKSFSVLASCGKFKTMMRLMCYVAHLGGHRRIEESTVAQQVLKSNPVFKALNNFVAIQIKFSTHNGIFVEIQYAKFEKTYGAAMGPPLTERFSTFIIIVLEQNHHCFFLLSDVLMEINKMCRFRGPEAFSYIKRSYCLAGITDAHDFPNIEKEMKIVGLSNAEQVTNFKILAFVMMLSNMAYFMRHQDTILVTREVDFVGHQSSAARSIKNSRHVRKFFVYV
ncbi:hypothetical protein FXO38_32504 [Capsicum annuum]|uniref:Myosin motor domain-containing protein n=1 Tax=Capsicum annuum TaxID=4072 RepID=A0A2G3AEG7_CAPAN|nr:hypothetical protein FXO38_32504 [Capsicum annuum]KAF3622634.1 hypothetical protein FXO37_32260 [Capsicum annuum]PHT92629.1 hypothetical protein T459_00511 [Capsicum annuum]